jgi:hypothetical protein
MALARGGDSCHCIRLYQNATLREIIMVDRQETSLIPVMTALQMHPVLEKVTMAFFRSLAGIDVLLRGKHSQLEELTVEIQWSYWCAGVRL